MAEEGEVHEPSDFELKVEKIKPARFIAKKAQPCGLYISADVSVLRFFQPLLIVKQSASFVKAISLNDF